jgi:surface polysaccharide O-acyltransferase-like enzyme
VINKLWGGSILNERNKNLDLLRVLASFMVILLHVSTKYVVENIGSPNLYFTIGNFFNSITRISVPIFVMLSGAFILDNVKNKDYEFFYKKTFKTIIIPTLLWSLIYCIYSISLEILKGLIGLETNYFMPFLNWANGRPFYHLWYMYMVVGLYLIAPILIKVKEDIGDKKTLILGWILMLLGVIIKFTSKLFWPIQFILYLGYFILGYSLNKYYISNNKKPFKYILGTVISGLSVFLITELIVRMGWLKNDQLYFYSNLAPFVIIGSICIFIAFINIRELKIPAFIDGIAKHSFNIYMIHAGILNIIDLITIKVLNWNPNPNPIWYIPLLAVFAFGLSYIGSLIIKWILRFKISKNIEKKIENIYS